MQGYRFARGGGGGAAWSGDFYDADDETATNAALGHGSRDNKFDVCSAGYSSTRKGGKGETDPLELRRPVINVTNTEPKHVFAVIRGDNCPFRPLGAPGSGRRGTGWSNTAMRAHP